MPLTVDRLLAGVSEQWRQCFDLKALEAIVAELQSIETELAPPADQIFEAFRYFGPLEAAVVIIGQDPYPTVGDAHGLSFSVRPGRAIPHSLRNIFKCLERSRLRSAMDKKQYCGDLRPWAVQGVLMLNTALTTRTAHTNAHAALWKSFMATFMARFCKMRAADVAHPLTFMLWGGKARGFGGQAALHNHTVLSWSHPSPVSDNKLAPELKFEACPHFREVNAQSKGVEGGSRGVAAGSLPIYWNNQAPVMAFSDGACWGNGSPKARASFAAVIVGGQFRRSTIKGPVLPHLYEFVDATRPEAGIRPRATTHAAPSNNRGEILGVVYCLLGLLRGRAVGTVEICSDSAITLKTLTEWLPARRSKGTEQKLKNMDLLTIAEALLGGLRAQASAVALTHVNSHTERPDGTAGGHRELLVWTGNDRADQLATSVLASAESAAEDETPRGYGIQICTHLRVLKTLGHVGM
jgi:uracil-DNA glycosylase